MRPHEIATYAAQVESLCAEIEIAIDDEDRCLALRTAIVALMQAPQPQSSAIVVGLFNQFLRHCDSVDHRIARHQAAASKETAAFLKLAVRQLKDTAGGLHAALSARAAQ